MFPVTSRPQGAGVVPLSPPAPRAHRKGSQESGHGKQEDAAPADLRLDAHDVAAMPQLCHAKAARPAQVVQVGQHSLMMLGCAKLGDSPPAKSEVHACLQIAACAVRLCENMCVRRKCNGDLP